MKHRAEDWRPAYQEYAQELAEAVAGEPSDQTRDDLLTALDEAIEREAEPIREYLKAEHRLRLAEGRLEAIAWVSRAGLARTVDGLIKQEEPLCRAERDAAKIRKHELLTDEVQKFLGRIRRLTRLRDALPESG